MLVTKKDVIMKGKLKDVLGLPAVTIGIEIDVNKQVQDVVEMEVKKEKEKACNMKPEEVAGNVTVRVTAPIAKGKDGTKDQKSRWDLVADKESEPSSASMSMSQPHQEKGRGKRKREGEEYRKAVTPDQNIPKEREMSRERKSRSWSSTSRRRARERERRGESSDPEDRRHDAKVQRHSEERGFKSKPNYNPRCWYGRHCNKRNCQFNHEESLDRGERSRRNTSRSRSREG